jgi:F-type H+-transporting ATPase subunit b
MPQLDFSNPLMLSKLVWMLIIFGLLFYILKTYALPEVASVLDERAARIAADLDAARDAQAAGEAAMAELRATTAAARPRPRPPWPTRWPRRRPPPPARPMRSTDASPPRSRAPRQQVRAARDSAMGAAARGGDRDDTRRC